MTAKTNPPVPKQTITVENDTVTLKIGDQSIAIDTDTIKYSRTVEPPALGPVSGSAKASASKEEKDGRDIYTASVAMEGAIKLSGKLPLAYGLQLTAEGGVSRQGKVQFQLSVPEGVQPGTINPFDPARLPKGVIITLDQSETNGRKGELGLQRGGVGVNVTGEREIKEGSSVSVKSLGGGLVEVTAGNSNAVKRTAGIGISLGDHFSASASNGVDMQGSVMRTATLDLNTREGRAAYDAILFKGTFPDKSDPDKGISNVRLIKTYGKDFLPDWELKAGDYTRTSQNDPQTFRSAVSTYNPNNGITAYTHVIEYPGQVKLTMQRQFKDQVEIVDNRKYQFELPIRNAADLKAFQALSFTKGEDKAIDQLSSKGPFPVTVKLTLSEGDMRKMIAVAKDAERNAVDFGSTPATRSAFKAYGAAAVQSAYLHPDTGANALAPHYGANNVSVGPADKASLAFAQALARNMQVGMTGHLTLSGTITQFNQVTGLHRIADGADADNRYQMHDGKDLATLPGSAQVVQPSGPAR